MKRSISPIALLFTSMSAILGSGWLFSSYYTATLAGPAALLAWLVGGGAVIIIAFVFAELTSMIPVMGSSTRIPHYTHGSIVSFIFAWMIWVSYAALVSTEVQAIIQYLSFYFPTFIHTDGGLTHTGFAAATALMLAVNAINIFSLRWLIRTNNIFTVIKILIPVFISIILLLVHFSPKHVIHPGHSSFMPYGWHGIFAAISTGGIVFAFNGFKQACEMAGEAKRPAIALPFAIIGSIALCLAVYLILQAAFLSSITAPDLKNGWTHLALAGGNSPFAAITVRDHRTWLLPILYIGAIIGPLAAALMYAGSASRSLYGKSKNGYLPIFLQRLTKQGNPVYAILVSFLLGMCLFMPLPGWNKMVSFLTSLVAVTYAIAPICLLTLRKQVPNQPRPFKLPFHVIWANLAFYICTLMVYWTGWQIISKLFIAVVLGLCVLFFYHRFNRRSRQFKLQWRASTWVWPYFVGITIISYLGNFGGGKGILPFGWDFAVIAVFCVIITWLAQRYCLSPQKTKAYLQKLKLSSNA